MSKGACKRAEETNEQQDSKNPSILGRPYQASQIDDGRRTYQEDEKSAFSRRYKNFGNGQQEANSRHFERGPIEK